MLHSIHLLLLLSSFYDFLHDKSSLKDVIIDTLNTLSKVYYKKTYLSYMGLSLNYIIIYLARNIESRFNWSQPINIYKVIPRFEASLWH